MIKHIKELSWLHTFWVIGKGSPPTHEKTHKKNCPIKNIAHKNSAGSSDFVVVDFSYPKLFSQEDQQIRANFYLHINTFLLKWCYLH